MLIIIVGGVQSRPEQREFNVMRVVKRVDTDDMFVVDNVDIGDDDFNNMFLGHEEQFGQ